MAAIKPEQAGKAPTLYEVQKKGGGIKKGRTPKGLEPEDYLKLYKTMLLIRTIDGRMLTLQRQGRITFYGTATGQEASVVGSGYALNASDWVLPALREGGVALLRGFPLSDYVNQVFCNADDLLRGRQMPCHYGDKRVNYVTLSSNIATQLPHAVGVAMAQKLRKTDKITIGYMGDGATSEADFHVAMEFASRLNAPVLFFCQNNQWAISTGWKQQTLAKSFAAKAHGYGMDGYRVDGNDILAVHEVTRHAADQIRKTGRPVFIESLTYRVGAHSTSDDPSRYRDESVTEEWKKRDPILRFKNTLFELGLWTQEEDDALEAQYVEQIKAEITRAEAVGPPALDTLFDEVYAETPAHLIEQKQALRSALSARKEY